MAFDPHALKLYVDGSCLKNPGGSSGFACWVEYPAGWNLGDKELEAIGFHESTNNRMELEAVIWALEWIIDSSVSPGVNRFQVVTDSKYVFENWKRVEHWRRNGWRNASGRPVENHEMWKRFLSVRSKIRVRTDIELTLGKKSPVLRAVDKSAKTAAKAPLQIDRGFKAGKVGRSKNKVTGAAALFPAAGQTATIRIYQSGTVVDGENKVKFQTYCEKRQDFYDKFVAYALPEIGGHLHRQHTYLVEFNSQPKYPIIQRILNEVEKEN
jgi:ribonuclease HI